MTEFRDIKLPEFKLGINGMGKSVSRDMIPFQDSMHKLYFNKSLIVPKPQPNIFFTPIEDNREQILHMMKNNLDNQLEFTRTYLPPR